MWQLTEHSGIVVGAPRLPRKKWGGWRRSWTSSGKPEKSGDLGSSWSLLTMAEQDPRKTVCPSSPPLGRVLWEGADSYLEFWVRKVRLGKGNLFFPVPGDLTWFWQVWVQFLPCPSLVIPLVCRRQMWSGTGSAPSALVWG